MYESTSFFKRLFVQFLTPDGHIIRSVDTKADLVTTNVEHDDFDVVANLERDSPVTAG